jgi:5-(carboxyamino)imidazole ribonucleotide synthase
VSGRPAPGLSPNATIGIIGGGQLGRMSAMAAARLGYRCHIFSPEPDSPAAQVSAACTVADYEDVAALRRFAGAVDVITFEFENVSAQGLDLLQSLRTVRSVAWRQRPGGAARCRRRAQAAGGAEDDARRL